MGLTADIAASEKLNVVRFGSLELVAWCDKASLLRAAESRNVPILGLEGFKIGTSSVSPDMAAIADFSDVARGNARVIETCAAARRFSKQLHFDIVWEE